MADATTALERAGSARQEEPQAITVVAAGLVREPNWVLAPQGPGLPANRAVARTQFCVTMVELRLVARNLTIVSECFWCSVRNIVFLRGIIE